MITGINIKYIEHEYHFEHINTSSIEVYLDGIYIRRFSNLCSAIGHCVEQKNFDTDLQYVQQNRASGYTK